ncbi:spore cortex formation protein SpoVR/YcgB (stage V sporulation) [Bradyrhizobium sp. LM2.7]
MTERLFEGADWDFHTLQRISDACEEVALKDLGLDVYPNQIEVITAEQMLDAYSSVGMPLFYKHWSFGKHFAYHEASYRKGLMGLAYEIVINSSPCISYLMEENTATMQTLVIAHAAFGHNHFFKNNYLFKQWTDADGILDYLDFAKKYVMSCEARHGRVEVERTLDAAHALMSHGIDRYPGKKKLDLRAEEKRAGRRRQHEEEVFNDLWRTVPAGKSKSRSAISVERRRKLLGLPQENLLYFLEKSAPRLAPWQRELLRIVRHIAQYFYPQSQTKVMNEGTATYVHYRIMTKAARAGSAHRRQLPRIPAIPHQRGVPARIRRSALLGLQSLCARLFHDAGHRAHRHPAGRRGSRMVPGHRRKERCDGRAARRLGQLPRREFYRAVPEPEADAALPHVPPARRSRGARRHPGRCHSRRAWFPPGAARARAAA